jgi:hypothetical protein
VKELIIELCEGNPGALSVCVSLLKTFGTEPLKELKFLNIRGGAIWDLYKDECGEQILDTAVTLHRQYVNAVSRN